MPNFGFSAFLKLLSLRERPQRSAVRGRLGPSRGGYDFHRSFRLRALRLLSGAETLEEVLRSTGEITRGPEQRSAEAALTQLGAWRAERPGRVTSFGPVHFDSPNGLFRVGFEPNFGLALDGVPTAVHIWNNAVPELSVRETYAALSLMLPLYDGVADRPEDVAVLSVRTGELHRLSEAPDQSVLAERMVRSVEMLIEQVADELGPLGRRPEDRPRP